MIKDIESVLSVRSTLVACYHRDTRNLCDMIQYNPQYEAIFSSDNIDNDCDSIAHEVNAVGEVIKEILKVGM